MGSDFRPPTSDLGSPSPELIAAPAQILYAFLALFVVKFLRAIRDAFFQPQEGAEGARRGLAEDKGAAVEPAICAFLCLFAANPGWRRARDVRAAAAQLSVAICEICGDLFTADHADDRRFFR